MHRKKQIPRGEGKSQMKTKEWSVRGYKPKAKASEAVFFLLESLNHVLCKTKSTIVLLSFSSSRIILGRKKKQKPLLPFFCKDLLEKEEHVPNPPHEISCD